MQNLNLYKATGLTSNRHKFLNATNLSATNVPFYSYFCPTLSFCFLSGFILVFPPTFSHSHAGQPVIVNLTYISHHCWFFTIFLSFQSHYCQVSVDIIHPPCLRLSSFSGCFNVHYPTTSMFPLLFTPHIHQNILIPFTYSLNTRGFKHLCLP